MNSLLRSNMHNVQRPLNISWFLSNTMWKFILPMKFYRHWNYIKPWKPKSRSPHVTQLVACLVSMDKALSLFATWHLINKQLNRWALQLTRALTKATKPLYLPWGPYWIKPFLILMFIYSLDKLIYAYNILCMHSPLCPPVPLLVFQPSWQSITIMSLFVNLLRLTRATLPEHGHGAIHPLEYA